MCDFATFLVPLERKKIEKKICYLKVTVTLLPSVSIRNYIHDIYKKRFKREQETCFVLKTHSQV